jgi:hypothetical protein
MVAINDSQQTIAVGAPAPIEPDDLPDFVSLENDANVE